MIYLKETYENYIGYKNSTDCNIDYLENDSWYFLYLSNGDFRIQCSIEKKNPKSEDQIDFETNYKNLPDTNAKYNSVVEVSDSAPFARPDFKTRRDGDSAWREVEADSINTSEYKLLNERYVSGGECIVIGAKKGDWISAEVNDKDGVIPEIYRDALTENYPTVSQYVIRANMSPDSSSKIYTLNTYPLNAKLTPGLYLMIKYHASSEIGTRSFVSNYYLSEKL